MSINSDRETERKRDNHTNKDKRDGQTNIHTRGERREKMLPIRYADEKKHVKINYRRYAKNITIFFFRCLVFLMTTNFIHKPKFNSNIKMKR